MKRRTVIVYWLLLLVPTAAICLAAVHLLRHEQGRLAERAKVAALEQAHAVADSLELAVGETQDALLERLQRLSEGAPLPALTVWERENPLVRNVFVWEPGRGLVYPHPDARSTPEELRFRARYEAMFSGRIPWTMAAASRADAPSPAAVDGDPLTSSQPYERRRGVFRELKALSSAAPASSLPAPAAVASSSSVEGGWVPWYSENQLSLLGWTRRSGDAPVIGLEIEFAALLSRLVTLLPAMQDGRTMALVDGGGRVVHQTGGRDLSAPEALDAGLSVSLDPLLPHWRVQVFADNNFAPPGGGLFLMFSGLLLIIFVAAIVGGGALLTLEARRSQRDALRKTSFVSNVSHELKTPLTSIRMYAELLSENRVTDVDKRARYLEVIASESRRLTRLVNNVLDFSRLEQGRRKYRCEAIDLCVFLPRLLEDYRLRIDEAGMTPTLDFPGTPCVVWVDRDALEQVVLNLVDNAIKYAAGGGELRLWLEPAGGACRLWVMDRGPGVPAAHRARIFEKFHRVDDSLTASRPGSGLGLTIARALLRDLGGDLTYQPRVEGGSCFIVAVPSSAGLAGGKGKDV